MTANYIHLTTSEYSILNSYNNLMDGLGKYLGNGYELILYSLEDLNASIIKIVNDSRCDVKIGAPLPDYYFSILEKIEKNYNHAIDSYFIKKNGVLIRTNPLPILGDNNRIIAILCINFYTDTAIATLIENYMPLRDKQNIVVENNDNITQNTDEFIFSTYNSVKDEILNDNTISSSNKNKEIISQLYIKGIFNLKDSTEKIAKLMNISKNTVYMHVRNIKNKK